LWIASWNGGVVYFKDGKVRESYRPDSGLAPWRVNSLQFDSSGALWAGIDGGLSRIKDGRVITLNSKNGLPCDAAHDLLEDDAHSLWVYTACGLVRIARSELDAWVADPARRIDFTVFGVSDGVRIRQGIFNPAPRSAKTADGRLWFLPFDGALIVDPSHLPTNRLPPPVHIEQLIANGQIYEAAQGLRLPPRIFDLVVNYTALSMVDSEKVRFRFKLEGQDRDWREVVNDRKVQYTNLPPGPYRFRVIACNNSGVWNEQGDTLAFSITPAYYQTNWFLALCAAALLILAWAAYQYRVRHLHREFALILEARVGERTRIARDLHDTLLQSFHAVLLRLQTVSQLLRERPAEAQDELDSTINEVAEAITEGRDAVQGLRESTVQKNDLALAISTLGEELATDSSGNRPAFRVAVEGESRNLHPIVRDEIYRIAGEALRNAFRHAHAHKVEVEIRYDDEQFRLRVRDDGRGIDLAALSRQGSEGHFGLHGMRERATLIGGKLVVWSEVGGGTEVELLVPASAAYAAAARRIWLSEWLAKK
jgi:signal transduction histidine kinase